MTMNDYFSKMKHLFDKPVIVGKLVEQNDLITYIIIGLNSQDYKTLVTILLAKGENISLDNLCALLMSHKGRLE